MIVIGSTVISMAIAGSLGIGVGASVNDAYDSTADWLNGRKSQTELRVENARLKTKLEYMKKFGDKFIQGR